MAVELFATLNIPAPNGYCSYIYVSKLNTPRNAGGQQSHLAWSDLPFVSKSVSLQNLPVHMDACMPKVSWEWQRSAHLSDRNVLGLLFFPE